MVIQYYVGVRVFDSLHGCGLHLAVKILNSTIIERLYPFAWPVDAVCSIFQFANSYIPVTNSYIQVS